MKYIYTILQKYQKTDFRRDYYFTNGLQRVLIFVIQNIYQRVVDISNCSSTIRILFFFSYLMISLQYQLSHVSNILLKMIDSNEINGNFYIDCRTVRQVILMPTFSTYLLWCGKQTQTVRLDAIFIENSKQLAVLIQMDCLLIRLFFQIPNLDSIADTCLSQLSG